MEDAVASAHELNYGPIFGASMGILLQFGIPHERTRQGHSFSAIQHHPPQMCSHRTESIVKGIVVGIVFLPTTKCNYLACWDAGGWVQKESTGRFTCAH